MHQGIDERTREKLYANILDVIEWFGGKVEQPRAIALFHVAVKK